MKTALVALAVVLAANAAHAQAFRWHPSRFPDADSPRTVAEIASTARAAAAAGQARSRTIETTLTAMNDGPEAGGRVSAYLSDKKVSVYTATQAEPVKVEVVNGQRSIVLSDALPAHPRVYAPLIAAAAAADIYADMPATGEREYMVMATAARVFSELGGDFKALPKVDGDDASVVKDLVSWWTGGVESTVEALAHRANQPTIPDLRGTVSSPAAVAAIDAADKRFVAFLIDERDARAAAGLR